MGRLIDADALIDLFTKDKELLQRGLSKDSKFAYMTADYVIKTISEQPTAYDVEKVVAELKEEESKSFKKCKEEIELFKEEFWRGRMTALQQAIDIVKRGGINE